MSSNPVKNPLKENKPLTPLKYYPPGSKEIDLSKHQCGDKGFNELVKNFIKNFPDSVKKLELLEKVVIVGDASVGKTCLILRYSDENYTHDYKSTVGVDFFWKKFAIENLKFTLHMWDTAGQERFRALSHAYYRGSAACIVAFNLGIPETFRRAKMWAAEVMRENRSKRDFCMFLVGCKSDMVHVVPKTEIEKLAQEINAEFFAVSAKTGENVNWLFGRVAAVLFERSLIKAALTLKSDEEVSDVSKVDDVITFKSGTRNQVMPIGGGSGIGSASLGKGTADWKKPSSRANASQAIVIKQKRNRCY